MQCLNLSSQHHWERTSYIPLLIYRCFSVSVQKFLKCKISGESVFLDQEPPVVVLEIIIVVGKITQTEPISHSSPHLSFQRKVSGIYLSKKVSTASNNEAFFTKFVLPVGIQFAAIEH